MASLKPRPKAPPTAGPEIDPSKTALRRFKFSRPMRLTLEAGLLSKTDAILDYGAGLGDDVRLLKLEGYKAAAWDPHHAPKRLPKATPIVNLGYVLNVIHDPKERAETLKKAFALSGKLLVVSALLDTYQNKSASMQPHLDGYLTSKNTFQKLFTQQELRDYLAAALDIDPIAAGPGVFFVFRDQHLREQHLSKRFSSRRALKQQEADAKREPPDALITQFANLVSDLGRLPQQDEVKDWAELNKKYGSIRRAFTKAQEYFPQLDITSARTRRRDDLLVYIAMSKLGRMPRFGDIPPSSQFDIKAFFGNYTKAQEAAWSLLQEAAQPEKVWAACAAQTFGKLVNVDYYVHADYIYSLPPVLRVYFACAERLTGPMPEGNIIKFHMRSGKLSFLSYPDFDAKPHPQLTSATVVNLGTLQIFFRDYQHAADSPILHRKDRFLPPEDKRYMLFKKLTTAEEAVGLLNEAYQVGYRKPWEARLASQGFSFKGHQLISAGGPQS